MLTCRRYVARPSNRRVRVCIPHQSDCCIKVSYHIAAFRYLALNSASGYYFLANDVMESGGCAQRLTLPEILGSLDLRCSLLLLKVMRYFRSLENYAIFFYHENENMSYTSCHISTHQSDKNNFCMHRMTMRRMTKITCTQKFVLCFNPIIFLWTLWWNHYEGTLVK